MARRRLVALEAELAEVLGFDPPTCDGCGETTCPGCDGGDA